MTDITEEGGLGAIEFRKHFCAFSFFFVCAGFGYCSGDLSRCQFEECAIARIEPFARIDARNHKSHGEWLPRNSERQYDPASRPNWPGPARQGTDPFR